MNIVYCGHGVVGNLCLECLSQFPVSITVSPQLKGKEFTEFLMKLHDRPDVIFSVHWKNIFTQKDIRIPKIGILNLHNSYLPWNKGADACSWAIIDNTPHGASMHWVDSGIDTGPIFLQEEIAISDNDTTDSLYKKTQDVEVKVMKRSIEKLLSGDFSSTTQVGNGTFHKKSDFQRILRAASSCHYEVIQI